MIAVDGSYLYGLGQAIKPLHDIKKEDHYLEIWMKCYTARQSLETFISNSVYTNAIRIMVEPANALINTLNEIGGKLPKVAAKEPKIEPPELYNLQKHLQEFESVFRAELKIGNLFLATPKGAYDLRILIANGESIFPTSCQTLLTEVALKDVREGARCLAFELYTASGFHFHRANESVILRYLKALNVNVPKNKNLSTYLKALEDAKAPKQIVSCLRDLKDMHRNPLMHPDQSINDFGDALYWLALFKAL